MSTTWACPDCGIGNSNQESTCSCGYEWDARMAPPPSIVLASSAEMYLWLSRASVVFKIFAYLLIPGVLLTIMVKLAAHIEALATTKERGFAVLAFDLVLTILGGAISFILLRGAEQACILLLGVHRRVGSIDERRSRDRAS